MTLSTSQILQNRYRIVLKIAEGGFGAIYRAWDLTLKKPCAVKENFETSPAAQKQFEREAVILAGLYYSNLPRVTDHFIIPGQGQYLVMDFVEGEDLQTILDRQGGLLPESQVLPWIEQICDALTYLHTQNPPIIHRDIKPANIKITPEGKAMLVDFGIAKVYDPLTKTTRSAQAVTPGYSPIEQYGHGITDARSDIYALAATLYTLLTGSIPPESTQRAVRDTFVPPEQLNPGISSPAVAAIRQALQVDAARRHHSAAAFKAALRRKTVMSSAYQPTPLKSTVQSPQVQSVPTQPRPGWLLLAGLGFVGLIVMMAAVIYFVVNPPVSTPETIVETVFVTAEASQSVGVTVTPTPISTDTPQGGDAGLDTNTPQYNPTLTHSNTPTLTPTDTPTALPADPLACTQIGQTWVSPVDGMTLVCVPAGEFIMGSSSLDSLSDDYERPQHTVYLDAFWIDQTEVTNAMFARFIDATGHTTQAEIDGWSWDYDGTSWSQPNGADWRHPRGRSSSLQGLDDHPVVRISWDDSLAYCSWTGRRLLTEAEWEKAARGTDGRIYPWGDNSPSANLLNYNKNLGTTQLVGSYPAGISNYGAYDMAGNVWEWVIDWYREDYYSTAPHDNPTGPPSGDGRGMRGGSWFSNQKAVRSAYREWGRQAESYWSTGFRCALDASP